MKLDMARLPLSQARCAGELVFVSGQLPIGADGTVQGGDIAAQAVLALDNLTRALASEGAALGDVVKVGVILTDAALAAGFNAVYARYFQPPYPARTTIVAGLLVPADIEIEAIARLPAPARGRP